MTRLQEAMSAVRATPKDPAAWVQLGDLLREEGQGDKAQQSYQRALQLDPVNASAQQGLAALLAPAEPPAPPSPSPPRPAETPRAVAPLPEPAAAPAASPSTSPLDRARDARAKRLNTAPRDAIPAASPPRPIAQAGARAYPPRSQKPSPTRMWAGLLVIFGVPLLCLCVALFALVRTF